MKTLAALFLILCATLTLAPGDAHAISGLRVKCDQEGAEVFLNGKKVGLCPLKETFKAGTYTIELRKNLSDQSYYFYKSALTLQDGNPGKVDAVLEHVYPEAYWYQKAASTRSISDWDEYLRRYANGSHSAEVHRILENYFYEIARKSGSKGDWQEYLRRYANWSHGDEARQQVARLQQEESERAARAERERQEREVRELAVLRKQAQLMLEEIERNMVKVQGGCFQMGDTFGDGYSSEKPVHEVCLSSAYRIGKYEVTQGQWQKIMGSNPSHFSSCGDNCPVETVGWEDVQEFIRRLNSQTGKRYRLPTEAEWEYAARSGGKAEKYSGGDNPDAVAWYDGNSGSKTHPAGQKQSNGLGLYDMSGNVWEWVSDWYGAYPSGRQQDPPGPSGGSRRVCRGGSWGSDPGLVRAAYRANFDDPGLRDSDLGFRLVSPVQ